ncbi:alpha/beta hydrolase [Nocardia mangyaensis]|uniref:alpha/beta hydrolase n=1 Tax=Nocardia mangyaensis TaxID=2213200 RepID=UPI0026765154|nr:alpha/beta hydrolase family protein [Nocardia mangyaensis]MDO3646800.1 alpha/beta hydrolase family protein [Nocardia mangyaensis]
MWGSMVRRLALATALAAAGVPVVVTAQAAPETVAARALAAAEPAPDGSRAVAAVANGPGRVIDLTVYSAAMDRPITVAVLPAADPERPAGSLYLINGVDGGTDTADWREGSNWLTKTDAIDFFGAAQATIVMPIGGAGTFYTDWQADDPVTGRHRWLSFLTQELPPIIDSAFHGTGRDAVAGLSMASSAVFRMAQEAPHRFRMVGSFSGCVRTSDPAGQAMVASIVAARQGNPINMWGPPGHPAWAANDPYLQAEKLRGVQIYVSTGNGVPGPLDTLSGPGIAHNPVKLADQLLIGGVLDGITVVCTRLLRDRLAELDISATFDFRAAGTHSWGYWERDMHAFWERARALLTP